MTPARPLPRVGMAVRIVHLGAAEDATIAAIADDGRTLTVGVDEYTLRPLNGRFVRAGEPYYGTRLVLAP